MPKGHPHVAIELQREAEELASRLMFDTRLLRRADRGLWERWPVRKAQEVDLSAWVEKHCGPGSQGEAGPPL